MSNLNDFLPNAQSFDMQNITSSGSSDNTSPTVLDTGKDMYYFNFNPPGSFRYFQLPDGTTTGQRTMLIHKPAPSGTAIQVKFTVEHHTDGPTLTYRSLQRDGNCNYDLVWNGTAWHFTSEDN